MNRRPLLALGGIAVSGGLAILHRDGPRQSYPASRGLASVETPSTTQFQYDARNSGVSPGGAPGTSRLRWRTRIDPIEGGLSVANDTVLVSARGDLVALDANDGEKLWRTEVGHSIGATPAVAADTAYVGAWNGLGSWEQGLVAVDIDDGSERWRAIPDTHVTTAPTVADDTIYLGAALDRKSVIALDAADGEESWQFDAGIDAPPPAVADGAVFVSGGEEPVAYALDADDGDELWRFETHGQVLGAPTVVDDTVYVGSGVERELGREREDGEVVERVVHPGNGIVYALDVNSGEERWHASVDSAIQASVAATAESVYVAAKESLTAFDADGEERWSNDLFDAEQPPTVAGDRVVVADGRRAYCFYVGDGTELWRREAGERFIADAGYGGFESEVVVCGGVAFLPSHSGDVCALQ